MLSLGQGPAEEDSAGRDGRRAVFEDLPQELVDQIVSYLFPPYTRSSKNLGHLLTISWPFYNAALPLIYRFPTLRNQNYRNFHDTIESSRKIQRKNQPRLDISHDKPMGDYVHILDLRRIAHVIKHSQMSRLVRHCSDKLIEFYAPQSGFSQSVFRTLSVCQRLRVLDLNAVSERVEIRLFLSAIEKVHTLESVNFPRLSKDSERVGGGTPLHVIWPPNLIHVGLSGAISDRFLKDCPLPETIRSLGLQICIHLTTHGVHDLLDAIGPNLESLSVTYPMNISHDALDKVLQQCGRLRNFTCYIEYLTRSFLLPFTAEPTSDQDHATGRRHPLRSLHLDSAGLLLDTENKIKADDVLCAVLLGPLKHLQIVKWGIMLGWRADFSDVKDLAELLEDNGGFVRCTGP